MSRTAFNRLTAISLVAVLAGCQSLSVGQQGSQSIFGGGGATANGGSTTPLVSDPYAGQGVATPSASGGSNASSGNNSKKNTSTTKTAAATTHKVVAGETGWSIARKYDISIQELSAANDLNENVTIRVGQVLKIPARKIAQLNDATVPGQGTPVPPPPSASEPLPNETTQPASKPVPKPPTPDLGATRTAASGSGRLQMPVAGSIVGPYRKGSNNGIDISAGSGAVVKAAGSGSVAAITQDTNGVPIVVIRHQGELMTVYAGLSTLSVKKGDKVSSGQKIGTAGNSGSVHFEVRKGFESVDPEGYL